MKINALLLSAIAAFASPTAIFAHDNGAAHGDPRFAPQNFSTQPPSEMLEILRAGKGVPSADSDAIKALTARYLSRRSNRPSDAGGSEPSTFTGRQANSATGADIAAPQWQFVTTPFSLSDVSASDAFTLTSYTAPAGNGTLMAASFGAFKPRVRFFWDGTTFYEESDNMPDNTTMPNLMVGITSWQQQIPVPASYFANTTNPENSTSSLGYGQPNYWRLPLVPVPSASPIPISAGNFQRGAVAIAANGIAIFNPKNNTGAVSYAIGELDAYGGHCGLADDYHYHIIPTHLLSAFGGVLSNDKPVAWALDGYPIYGYVEPDGTARQALDVDGGHDIGSGWGYHYHAMGTTTVDASHPYGTPQSPYLMNNFHGTVVNFGGQVDGQPEVGPIRASGTGGYTAQPVSGASIIAFKNPVALTTDVSGNLIENVGGTASADSYLMRVSISGTSYDECWKINRNTNPRTMTVTWRLAAATTTTTYTPNATGNRLAAYGMAAASQVKLPDTSQTLDTTATFGEDADYTILPQANPQSFTDNGNGTITDNVTGLMWQKTDNGESTWDTAVTNAAGIATGGFTDWRLPTPSELFSIFNHNNGNPALNITYFPSNSVGAADYWWTSDIYGSSTTNVWCSNAGGGLGGKPKSETISAGGVLRYSARYVRGAKPTNGHNYLNNGDGTITDLDMGLMWTQLPGAGTTWDAALSYAENLTFAGFTDWRLPNVKELQTLTDYTLATATSTTGIKPSINRTMFAKTLTGCITSTGGTTVTCADTTGLLVGMPLVDTADIAGSYIPTATPPTVATIPSATTFTVSSGTGIVAGSNLTLKALAPPTAFWTSTSQNNATTNAWVVEFGINTSSTPPRNSQGIISYNVKTATYPVFAVRSTSVTTNTAPTITAISGATTMKNNATTAIAFTVGDAETAAASLTVSATSSNTTLVPNANITFGGSGANRTVIVTPASGQVGTVTITVTVSDGTTTTSTTFTLTVTPPNILLIIADDLGIDALTIYSSLLGNGATGQFPPTPAIASLAANGVQFNRAYTYTVCSPSRSSMLTGRFAYRTGVGNVVAGSSNNFLQATEFTLPRAFAANSALNFQLKHFGKWHLTSTTGTSANLGPCLIGGWPAFVGTLPGQLASFTSWTKVISDGTAGGTSSSTSTAYETTDIVTDAVSFIGTQTTAGKPWFATVAFNAPHITSGSPFYELPPTSLLTAPYNAYTGTSADILANPRNYFDATIQAMDTEMVRLLASVDFSKTNVIFVGDNGTFGSTAANSGSVIQSPFSANKAKATLYEGGIRVPLIIRGPDVVAPGRTTDALTHFVDLYSTILEMAGINVASTVATAGATIDSHSLLPVLQNTTSTQSSLIYGEEFDIAFSALGGRCLRDSQYKLIRKAAGVNLTTDEFYDLLADPYEATNLLAGGYASMTTARQTAYNTLVTQLATFNTAPTISTIAAQSTATSTATGAIAFTVGDAEMSPTILTSTSSSSNTTLVPAANVVLGGSGASRTATITPATGQTGTSTITVNVTDGAFTTSTSFVLTVGSLTTVGSVTANPAAPTNTDAVTITANVSPAVSRTISGVQLSYNSGAQGTAPVFQEIFANASTASAVTGAMNAWTSTAVRAATDVKLRGGTGNHTVPIVLTNCTTNGTTTVTCASTTGLIAGMSISGTNIAAGTTISSITNSTTFVTGIAASGSGSGLSLTAAGVTLTGCSASGTTVTYASTTGLSIGMGVSGTGLVTNPPNTPLVIATIPSSTTFTFAGATITTCPATLTASGCGLELSTGTATYTDTMATTTNAINAGSATAGNVEFYVRTSDLVSNHGWTFQISPDGGTTWNTRLSESYAAGALSSCTLNSANNQATGSTTILCSDTTGLATGMTMQGATVQMASCTTSITTNPTVVLTANTTGLAIGMFVNGPPTTGIPNGAHITAISSGVSFTMNVSATVAATSNLTANYISANTTISSITANVSFVVSNAAFYSGAVSLINHSFMLKHYDLVAGDRTATMKMRFQWSGGTATPPARTPTCDMDDVVVTLTTGAAPATLTMFDDGAHGDGAAGDGVYGATVPVQSTGSTVSYTITATDSAAGTATSSGSYTVATAAPVLAVTPATTLSSAGAAGSGSFSPASIAYTLTNSGTGTMSWTASKTQSWLNLSATSGTLAAGANTTVTASINTANANALVANTYNDTVTFTNSTNGSGNTTRAASLLVTTGTPTAPAAPAIVTQSLFSAGTAKTITWPEVPTATSYTLQIASSANFTTNLLSTQTVAGASGTFTNLADGVTYFYRVLATNSVGSSAYSGTVSTTQDTGAPTVAITSPTTGTTQTGNTITVTGTASDTRSGISGVKVNNVAATSGNNFATWTATVPLGFGTNAITATATDGAGNQATTFPAVLVTCTTAQTYNPLIIPDTITGTTMNLALYQTSKKFPNLPTSANALGTNATTTMGYNGALMWGPTLIMNQGDTVQLNVTNNLNLSNSTLLRETTTTVHWHGFHIPAIMDGGPRQVIAGGTTWSPTFAVKNNAATYWYHPHLHIATQEQLTLGAGGLIIVRDAQEAALALPRTYGVDDIPLAVTTRRFLSASNEFSNNQFVQVDGATSTTDNYGDYVLVNGTLNPQVSLPQQYVRMRILIADIQRGYNLGFSDNRVFYVIANEQGLVNTPVAVTRVIMMPGERIEIMVNLGSDSVGGTLDLMAYNNFGTAAAPGGALFGFAGSESNTRTPNGAAGPENGGLLCNSDFRVLHINVAAATANPITAVPSPLARNTYWTDADVTNTRLVNITGGNGTTPGFTFNNLGYSPTLFNYSIPLNAVEKWTISGGTIFGHSVHIHDIKFNIISRTGTQVTSNGLPAAYESGWKDTVYVPRGETVSVIAKYDDFASPTNPYMFHCHMLNHEDGGLMGQFAVVNNATENLAIASFTRTGSSNLIAMNFNATNGTTYLLQYSPDMTTGSWVTIGSVTSNGTSATYTEADATRLSQARGFYRVVLPSVAATPVITSSLAASGTHGASFSYQITATGATSFSAAGLPAGLSVNNTTGLISGTPTTAATNNVSIIATNSGGSVHATLVITVN